MSAGNLTQAEADALMDMEKQRVDNKTWSYPSRGGKIEIPLTSKDRREDFILDFSRGSINLAKLKYQERARQIEVLIRLDIAGSKHRNPDDTELDTPHLHLYKEGYGDRWAVPVPVGKFTDLSDIYRTLDEFMLFCNITEPPKFQIVQQELPI
jgi:hypothetical protein